MTVTVQDYLVAPVVPPGHVPLSLPDMFSATVARDPDSIAVVDGHEHHTWRQWQDQARALACGLRDLGVGPGDVVATRLPNCMEFLVLHVAVAMLGAVLSPVHVETGRSELESLVRRVEPAAVVLPARWRDSDGRAVGTALRAEFQALGHVLLAGGPADEPDSLARLITRCAGSVPEPVAVAPEAPFVLVASSGTTAIRPKFCMHSHSGLLSNAMAVVSDGDLTSSDTMLSASPFSFLFGMLSVHVSIFTGGRQVLLHAWDVGRYATAVAAAAPTVLFAVPTQLRDILAEPDRNRTTKFREVRTGGAPVPEELVRSLTGSLAHRVTVQWGMSEIGAGIYTRPEDAADLASRTVGRAASGAQVRVVDDEGRACGDGQTGELQFRGESTFRGYYGEAELTARAFTADGWLRTGDLAELDAEGRVTLRGRVSSMINVGGRKVNPLEIEQQLADLAPLREAIVVGREDPRLGEVPVLVCAVRTGTGVTLDHVTKHLLAKGVAPYQLPVSVLVLDEVPHTHNGKPARRRAQEIAAVAQPVRPMPRHQLTEAVNQVRVAAEKIIGHSVRPADTFRDNGFDSTNGAELRLALSVATGLDLPTSLIFDYPTPIDVARLMIDVGSTSDRAGEPVPAAPVDEDPIVVVGMSCRLPGGIGSPDDFWHLLVNGREVRSELPTDRGWPLDRLCSTRPAEPGTIGTRHGGFLPSIADFDAGFFGIDAREARSMDPQQRILLETVWEALERTGVTAAELRGSDTGVFVGMMAADYAPRWFESPESYDGTLGIGTASSVASGRVAYLLGLHGIALTVDTACSSSLVAMHLAEQALRRGETGMALVAGVTVMSSPANLVEFGRQGLLAPDGRCKAFAADADGVGLSEGAGVVVLQRLSDARRMGRTILAVISGSAVNQDGASNGLTAPSGRAQELVIRGALRAAGLTAADVDAVEAHGTGTPLGDAIEIGALLAAYGEDRPPERPLWIGSVKSNLGHTQAAAGVMSVIKLVLALRHAVLPKTLHADSPRRELTESGLLCLPTEPVEWVPSSRPRRAAISSFGISGTNAHLVLQEPPAEDDRPVPASPHAPWLLSAKDAETLSAMAVKLADAPTHSGVDIGSALATGRTSFPHRAAVLPDHDGDHRPALRSLATGAPSADVLTGTALPGPVAFVFPGHGTQWPGMAAALLADSPVFAASIAECDEAFAAHVPWSLAAVLRGDHGAPSLELPEVAQPATFAVSVGLAALWRSYGVEPDVVVGHSQGEVAAAHVSGGLSLPDAARVIFARAAIVDRIAGRGAMVALAASRSYVDELVAWWPDELCVAVTNGPRSFVVSGDSEAVDELIDHATAQGIRAERLLGEVAFHSHHLEQHAADLLAPLRAIKPTSARIPFVSATTGGLVPTERLDAAHWYRNLRDPVDFAAATEALLDTGYQLFIEVSAHPVLTRAVEECVADREGTAVAVTSLRRGEGGPRRFLRSLADAHVHGARVDWPRVFGGRRDDASALPTYPFRRRHFWLEVASGPAAGPVAPPVRRAVDQDTGPGTLAALPEDRRAVVLLDAVLDSVIRVLELDNADDVTADTAFADLGLTSLAAVEVRNVLARVLGTSLPATVVLDSPDPAALAHRLTAFVRPPEPSGEPRDPVEAEPHAEPEVPIGVEALYRRLCAEGHIGPAWDVVNAASALRSKYSTEDVDPLSLVGFRHVVGRGQPTLVCLPSTVSLAGRAEYAKFAEPLRGVRDVLQLRAPGFQVGEQVPADLDVLVSTFLAALDDQVGSDPVVLCGHSFGGWIAHAMARRLVELGRPPEGVVLMDTFWPGEESIPRTLHWLVDRQRDLGTDLDIIQLTAIGWYLPLLAGWTPEPIDVPTLHVLPDDRSSLEPHRGARAWRLPHTEVPVSADGVSILDGDASSTADVVERWIATLAAAEETSGAVGAPVGRS